MKIFYITPRFPYPIDKGDKLRAFHQIRLLSKYHDVILFSLNEEDVNQKDLLYLETFCTKVYLKKLGKLDIIKNLTNSIFDKLPFQVSYFFSEKIKNEIQKSVDKENPDLIFCQLIRTSEYGKDFRQLKILDYVDALSKGLERRVKVDNLFLKPILKVEYNRVKRYEIEIAKNFDQQLIISQQDKTSLQNENLIVIPNGVDLDYFNWEKFKNVNKEFDILFTGNLSYLPNVKAIKFLIEEILPLVKKVIPNVKVALVGASPAKEFLKYRNENIIITGWVEDIREYYAKSKVFVAPMQIGSGMQNKILEAMAMKLPAVTSELVRKGLNAQEHKHLAVAESAVDYSKKIIELLSNSEKNNSLAEKGFSLVNESYSWEKIGNLLNESICKLVENAKKS